MLWLVSGKYNFIDNGYADIVRFFDLAPILLAILIPALTMRLFSEEKRNKTFDILRARPVSLLSIYFSKFLATFIFFLVTLTPTVIYVISLSLLANPIGSIDLNNIIVSYLSLILLSVVFITIGLFGSVISPNQIVSLIVSVFLCLFTFWGFELITGFLLSGKTQAIVSSFGLLHHYELMQRGVIQIKDLLVILNYCTLFIILSLLILRSNRQKLVITIAILSVLNILLYFIPNIRIDFSSDKRYTLSNYTKSTLENIEKEQNINIYLTGDLNSGFQRLQDATNNILTDYKRLANNNINITYSNPYQENNPNLFETMVNQGMPGIALNEMDREGKASRKIIYPYAQISNGKDTLVVSLLKNIAGYTAEENINASIETLEFEFTDAIRLLNQESFKSVAFIEGHNEIPRTYVYDAEEALSKYYFVNRGQIGNDINILSDFSAIIIAGPLLKYTEAEKYILDQYIMSGGRVLWLLDGTYYSHEELASKGFTASMKNDVNLDDILFSYGIRINSDLIQDMQCVSTYLMADDNSQSAAMIPSFYQPLLLPSQDFPITKNIRDVKAGFASSIDIVNNSPDTKKAILLTSSANTHIVNVPEPIDFDIERIQKQPDYFNQQFIPVAVSLEGIFNSGFQNRPIPDSVNIGTYQPLEKSKDTKMIVVSSSDIITNEIQGKGEASQALPMGYDRVSQQQFGNRDFIVNAVNWLTNNDELMALRTKKQQLYILNKKAAYENRDKYAIMNIGIPILFMSLIMGVAILYRRRKYEK